MKRCLWTRKAFACLLFTISFIPLAQAQYHAGVRAGINVSNQTWKLGLETDVDDAKPGFFIGGYVARDFTDRLALQPELMISCLGSKSNGGRYKLTYLSLPLLARYAFGNRFNVQLGPQVSFLLSGKYEDADIRESYKKLDAGVMVGAGIDIGPLNGGLRYYRGLVNAFSENEGQIKLTQSAFQIYVGYRLWERTLPEEDE